MYYLNCVKSVLQLDNKDAHFDRLTRYEFYRLSESDTDLLIRLCLAFSPNVLINKCIFNSDALCGDRGNVFYDLETVRNNLLVAGSVMVAGRTRRVTKIMTYKRSWMVNNYVTPLQTLLTLQQLKRTTRSLYWQ
ncbi:hypothetical protein DPMN_171455 [Dreissena polymorpha]|uniref:Uncharacterized protein n=1 Tax=Dreissena polymorpha TaxID=45954 RepID=A0A9D4DY15_DREPO|nr:hypothetical protein DPMN_171455 [Dreissena polymorpha]